MPDNLFDNFVGGKLNDHEAPVPNGLWDKLTERQFDEFIGGKLKDSESPVPEGLWGKITNAQLDNHFGETLGDYAAPVPEGLWEKVTDGHIDQFFGDKLNNYTAPVPAGLWEKIHPEEKDRKVVYWWRLPVAASLILAVLLGGAMGAYFWMRPQKDSDTNAVVKNQSPVTGTHKNGKENDPVKENIAPVDSATIPAEQPGSENKVTPATGSSLITKEKANVPGSITPAPLFNTTTVTNSKRNRSNADLSNGGHTTPFIPVTHNGDLTHKDGIPPITNNSSNDLTEQATDNKIITADQPFNKFSFAELMRMGRNGMFTHTPQELFDNNHTRQFKSNVICPTNRSNANTDWLLEVYASPDLAFKSVTNNSASAQYLQKKDSSESMMIGFTAGARIVKPLTDNILLKTGIQYTQMNERYTYRSENEIKTTTVVTVRTIIRAPGDTVVVSDTSSLQTIGYKNLTYKNRFRSIDVPLLIGYQFGNEDIKIGINAGVIFNLSSWYQGVLMDSTLAVVPLTKSNDMVYKSKLGLGLYAGISVSKQLGEDMQIFFEPYFRYNLSNMTSTQSSFNQKFSLGGLSIGLRFNLNR